MESYIQNIELINQYLNKSLSEEEVKNFENRLNTDSDFKKLYKEHIIFLEGLKRQALKVEIKSAKKYYTRKKWLGYSGLISLVLMLLALVYFNVFNSNKEYLKDKLNFEAEFIQRFQVPADSLVEIVGEMGTVVRFNPKDLQTSSHTSFKGDSLTIELIELITKQDLLLANAQTISNEKWLISGGVFKIDIKSNRNRLLLKEGKTINVKFPKSTEEDGMQIFYGKRDKKGYLNWRVSNIKLDEEMYYTIFYRDTSLIDYELTRRYGGVITYKDVLITDTLGYLKHRNIVEKFPKMKEIKTDKDTLRVYDATFYNLYEDSLTDSLGYTEVLEKKYISISKNQAEKIIKESNSSLEKYRLEQEAFKVFDKAANSFYKSIELSKLGWINIDKFAAEEEIVNIKINFNLQTNYSELYIVDENNNTVLNVFDTEVNLPKNKSFYVISIGIKGKEIYGYKKSVRFNSGGELKINYKKINENQLKSILTL